LFDWLFNYIAIPPKAKRAVSLDTVAGILVGIHTGGIFPFYLIIARQQLHASSFQISAMVAAPFFGHLLALYWANAMEGRSKMSFAVAAWTIARALVILTVAAVTPFTFTAIFCISQFLISAAGPAYAAIMKDVYPDEHRGRLMGHVRVALALFQIVTTFVAGWALTRYGANSLFHVGSYQWVFPAGALFGIASALVFSRIKTSPPTHEEKSNKTSIGPFLLSTFSILKQDNGFRWFALAVFTYGFGALIIAPLQPIYQVDALHITTEQAAVLSNAANLIWMFSFVFWGKYVDVRSPLKATVVNAFLAILCPLNYFIVAFFVHANVWMLLPSAVLTGITNAGIELAYFNTVLEFADENRVSHYQALFYWLLGLRGCVAPFIGGSLITLFAQKGLDGRYLFLLAAIIMLIGSAMQVVGMRREKSLLKA
jgi:hypothetical protein